MPNATQTDVITDMIAIDIYIYTFTFSAPCSRIWFGSKLLMINVWAILYRIHVTQTNPWHVIMPWHSIPPFFLHNIFARRQLNVRIYRFTPNLDRAESWLADTDPHHVMYLKTFLENNIYSMSQSLNASMRIIKSSLPWLKVLNSVFHRRLKYLDISVSAAVQAGSNPELQSTILPSQHKTESAQFFQ